MVAVSLIHMLHSLFERHKLQHKHTQILTQPKTQSYVLQNTIALVVCMMHPMIDGPKKYEANQAYGRTL